MVKHGVTIFFQGHDHLFVRQQRDGIVYQEVPMPADQGYVAYNEDRYESGINLANSGHLRVTVSPAEVKVDYVRCYLPKDETAGAKNRRGRLQLHDQGERLRAAETTLFGPLELAGKVRWCQGSERKRDEHALLVRQT